MTIDEKGVQAWLVRYIEAWNSNDEATIGALFAEDASYRYNPWDEPVRGRADIVRSWLDGPDVPGSWEADYRPVAVAGDVAVATGVSRYRATGDQPAREYHNVFLIEFDGEGRCRDFTEWYMKREGDEPAAAGA